MVDKYHLQELALVLAIGFILAVVLILQGCGSTTDRQNKLVETEKFVIPALVIDTPAGQFTIQPATVYRQREQTEVETTRKVIDVPDLATPIITAAGGTPWGVIIGGVVSAGMAAFAGKKAIEAQTARRQTVEVVDGVESAKDHMDPETWAKVRKTLADNQSDDTKKVVTARVG
jgi:hypothetical protein